MPNNQTVTSSFDVSGATNDELGVNGQSLQAICIDMVHDAVDEIDILLIAPDGSSVLLIDNTGLSVNDNIEFQICFVACSETANPDPGFSEVFDSSEDWQDGGSYSGSYYPAVGCLEDLTGVVNGEWTLEMTDFVGGDDGTMFDWCLQFADDDGLGCGTTCFDPGCEADGGEIPIITGSFCENDPDLDLDLTPTYSGNPPDPALYSYTYVFVEPGTNSVTQFSEDTDLTNFPPGEYQICGFSYLTADLPNLPIPPPPGYTFNDLVTDIANEEFCADLSNSCITIDIDPIPVAPEWTGPTSVCPGEVVTYQVLNYDAAEYSYQYIINQGTISSIVTTGDGSTVDVTWLDGPGELCVSATNGCGTADSCLQVVVEPPDTIEVAGNTEVCDADFETYTLSPPLEPGQNYVVSVTNGIAFPVQGNTVQVNWNPGTTGEICVSAVGPGCLPAEGCLEVTISPFTPPTFVDNSLSLCVDQFGFASVPDDPEVINYNWFGTGFDIISGQGTNEIEIQAIDAGTTETCVELETSCGLDTVCSQLIIFDVPDPMITNIQGSPECGEDFFIFLVFSPGTDLLWSVIDGPPGGLTLNGINAAVLNVEVNLSGTYSIQIEESIGNCVAYDTIVLDVAAGLGTTVSTECDLDGNFTVNLEINGGTEPFVVNGETIPGNVVVSDPLPSGSSYNYTIEDANGCSAEVGGTGVCPCLSFAGTMDGTLLEVCGATGQTVTVQAPADAFLDNNDAGVFVLHEGSGATLVNILETNNTGVFSFLPGMDFGETYYISYIVGNEQGAAVDLNDICLSVSVGQPVIFYDLPEIQYNGPTSSCENTFTLNVNLSPDALNTAWTITGPGTVDVQGVGTESATFTVSTPGVYNLEVITTNGPCFNSVFFDFEVFDALTVVQTDEECDGSDLYVLTLEFSGGTGPFTSNIPGTFNGNIFTSEFLITTDATEVIITDSEGCALNWISGPVNCDCESEAGFMSADTIRICEGETQAQITFLGGGEFDGDDTESFVLHSGSGTVILDPIFVFTGNTFGIIPGLIPGQVYYISHVVGNDLGGLVDLNDPCLDVSIGQPFIIQPTPEFDIADFTEACSGPVDIPIDNAGPGGQVALVNNSSGGAADVQLNGNIITVSSDIATTIEISYIESVGNCGRGDTITVIFFGSPELTNIEEECIGNEVLISFEITNGSPPYTVNGEDVAGFLFISDTIPSGQLAEFTIVDGRGCETFYSTTVDCQCVTDAGSLSGAIEEVCVGEDVDINSIVLNVGQLDPNDSIYLIVHDGTPTDIGNVVDTPQLGIIEYKPEFVAGETYYLAAIAGNPLNGGIDPNDPCFSSTNGLPVVWAEDNSASISGTFEGCVGDSVFFTINTSGAYPFDVYLSSDAGRQEQVAVSSFSTVVAVEILAGTEVWTIDSIAGTCAIIDNGQVVINGESVEVPQFADAPDICNDPIFGSILNLDDLVVNGVSGNWSSSVFTINNNSLDFDGVQAGNYAIDFTPDQQFCPSVSYSIDIEVLDCDCPVVTVPNGINLCVTVSDYDLDDRFNIGIGGVWTLDNPNGLPDPPVITGNLLDLSGSTSGTYGLIFTITDSISDQCEDQFTLDLNVVAEPEPGIQDFIPFICEGVDQDLALSTILADSDPGGVWRYGGSVVGDVINSSILSSGTNTFIYTVENNLCGADSVEVFVEVGPPPEAGQQAESQQWCENSGAQISLDVLLDGAAPGGFWTYGSEQLDSVLRIDDLVVGRNVLVYEVGTVACSDTAQVIIYVTPDPQYLLSALNVSCFGEDDGFIAVDPVDNGAGPYTVTINNIEQDQINNAGPGTYFIVVEDSIGCQITEFVTIGEPAALELALTSPDTIVEGDEATVLAVTNATDIAIEDWQYEGTLVDLPSLSLTYIPAATDTVTLEVVTDNGCTVSAETVIVVISDQDTVPTDTMEVDDEVIVYVPNVFNPTSQNPENQRFTIQLDESIEVVNYVRIFDRWGGLVYELNDQVPATALDTWDGSVNGQIVNPGVFVYSISFNTDNGRETIRYGDVTVVR